MSPPIEVSRPGRLGRLVRSRGLSLAILTLAGAVTAKVAMGSHRPASKWATVPVTRGSIVRSVIATGTVDPVVTVQVGSYVSGTIESLSCDLPYIPRRQIRSRSSRSSPATRIRSTSRL